MNENDVPVEYVPEILRQLPSTFQKFVFIYKEAKKKAINHKSNRNDMAENYQGTGENTQLDEPEFENIKRNISEFGIMIMDCIRNGGNSSKDLAERLDVSIDTIKRRYKDLVLQGMIKTSTKSGVRLTQKGLQFISRLKQKIKQGQAGELDALDAELAASNATNASIATN